MAGGVAGDVLGWDCWGADSGLRHANAVVLGVTPDEAMLQLLERVRTKYGADVDLSSWAWRAEPVPRGAGEVVRFAWAAGRLVRL